MKSTPSQVVQTAPGRLELVKNTRGRIPVDLTHPLPDGSRLTDPANRHLLATVLEVVVAAEPRLAGPSFSGVIGSLFLLVQWMFLQSIYRFGSLRDDHYQAYLKDSAKGLDYCIKATKRMREHIAALPKMTYCEREKLTVSAMFEAANIPSTYSPRLPITTALAKGFIEEGAAVLKKKALMAAPIERLTVASLSKRTSAVQRLWTSRDRLTDPATVQPYASGVAAQLRELGAPDRQTPIAPHAVAMKLLLGAMETVMSVGPAFLAWDASRNPNKRGDARHSVESFEVLSHVVRDQWNRSLVTKPVGTTPSHIVAQDIGRMLIPVASHIAIYGHVGRRKIEVQTLMSNCIQGEATEGRHLSAYIAKRQSFESRPCPEYVARAVHLMVEYQGYSSDDPQPLFRQRGKSTMMRVSDALNVFAELVGAHRYVDKDGHERAWHWRVHELRRLYVIYYVWRYDDASILALRHHLGHGSDKETAYYARLASDENYADFVVEVELFTLERLREVANGTLVGTFAQVLAKRIERAQARLKLIGCNGLQDALEHLVKEEGLAMHAGPWGYCGCKPTPSNLKRAQCMRKSPDRDRHPIFGTPVPENSDEETCGSCHFHSSGPSREPHWRNVVLRLDRAISGGKEGSMAVQILKQRRDKVNAAAERMFGMPD
jgi:hypothetical protein